MITSYHAGMGRVPLPFENVPAAAGPIAAAGQVEHDCAGNRSSPITAEPATSMPTTAMPTTPAPTVSYAPANPLNGANNCRQVHAADGRM